MIIFSFFHSLIVNYKGLEDLLAEESILNAEYERTLSAAFQEEKELKERDHEIIESIAIDRTAHVEKDITVLGMENTRFR